ncbi:unnamed protein product [Calypogeia fissa]
MPAAMVDATMANFEAMLAVSEVQGQGLLLLLFLGDRDTAMGGSWCPGRIPLRKAGQIQTFYCFSVFQVMAMEAYSDAFVLLDQKMDCVRAEPVIYKTLESSNKLMTLLRVYVGDRATWRTSSHPLRHDPRFLLKGVPTVVRWEDGKITGRLEDHEAHVEDKIKKLIS